MREIQPETPSLQKILWQTLVSLVLLVGLVFFLATFFRKELVHFSGIFLEEFGLLGLFFGMVLSDSLPAFVPPDAFLMMAIAQGREALPTILAMGSGSILGGSLAYGIGNKIIPRFSWGRQIVLHYEDRLLPWVRKAGFWAVVLAALTPIPYSWMAYTVGSFRMPFLWFFLGSLFRFLRMGIYFYAIVLGWVV